MCWLASQGNSSSVQVNGRTGDAESPQNRTNGGKMASALPGQLSPVRLLGWQWFLSVELWCPCGRRFCQSWQRLGITVSSLLCSYTTGWERCTQVSNFAGVPFSLSPFQRFPLCPSNMHPQTQTHSHQTHAHLYRDRHADTPAHSYPQHACIYALWNTHTHPPTIEHTLLVPARSLSCTHPLSSYWMWGSDSLLLILLPSLCFWQLFLPCSPCFFLNKTKWNQIQIWFDCYKRT